MNSRLKITSAIRSVPRAAEVATALTRFGFGALLREIGLERTTDGNGDDAAGGRPVPVRVRMLLEELGPTFIKLGQIASTRGDMLPDDWLDELSKLQGRVPPVDWDGDDGIRHFLESHLGDRIDAQFASIEHDALAGASIAQVHRATLHDGTAVVLKIIRPGVRDRLEADIELMRVLSRLVSTHLQAMGFDTDAVVDEFSRQLMRETDLLIEARSMERMRTSFADVDGIAFPRAYPELSTTSVLVMEEVEGTVLADLDPSTLDDATREIIVRNGADAVFRQCLEIGFFHADPHPGNLFVQDGGALCFIDCGMTGLIEPRTLDLLANVTYGAIRGDLDRVVRSAVELAHGEANLTHDRAFRSAVWRFIDQFRDGTLESVRMGALLEEFFQVLREFHLQCPADVVYLIKALATIEGVATSIAPEFDLVSYVQPYIERLVRDRHGVKAMKQRAERTLMQSMDLLEELPEDISGIVRALNRKTFSIQLDHQGVGKFTDEIERASMNISWSLGVAAVIVGSSVLVLADSIDRETSALTLIASIAFAIAVGSGTARLILLWLRKRR